MNILRRVLLVIWSLVLAGLGICLLAGATNSGIAAYWLDLVDNVLYNNFAIALLVAIVLIVLGVLGIIVGLQHNRKADLIPIASTGYGQVSISVDGIDSIVRKAIENLTEVRDVQCHIKSVPDGVALDLKVVVPHGLMIPNLAERLQAEVKSYLETMTSLKVTEVKVMVKSLIADNTINADEINKRTAKAPMCGQTVCVPSACPFLKDKVVAGGQASQSGMPDVPVDAEAQAAAVAENGNDTVDESRTEV